MAGIAGFTGLYLALFEKYNAGNLSTLLVLIGLCGAMAWARTALQRHTLRELFSGSVLGFFSLTYFFLGKSIRLLILLVPAEYYVDIYASVNAQEEQPHEKRNSSLYPSVRIHRNVNRR
jgi:hypothetical protein